MLVVGSDLNGPTIGAILTIVGFSAFGKHPWNVVPIMLGVFIASLTKQWDASTPSAVLAALFGTTLAPIAGRFGWRWGIVAGFIHSAVAQSVGQLHGGLVLYNDGFAAGLRRDGAGARHLRAAAAGRRQERTALAARCRAPRSRHGTAAQPVATPTPQAGANERAMLVRR